MALVGRETITRRRFAVGTRGTDGRFVPGAAADTPFVASVQAAAGQDLEILPEGKRTRDPKRVYTDPGFDLIGADQHTGESGDHLIIDGIEYEVFRVWDWRPASPLPHTKALAVRLQEVAT